MLLPTYISSDTVSKVDHYHNYGRLPICLCTWFLYFQRALEVISIIDLQDFSIQSFQASYGLRFLFRWILEYSSSAFSIKHHTVRAALLVGTGALAIGCLAVSFSRKNELLSRWCKQFLLRKADFVKEVNLPSGSRSCSLSLYQKL